MPVFSFCTYTCSKYDELPVYWNWIVGPGIIIIIESIQSPKILWHLVHFPMLSNYTPTIQTNINRDNDKSTSMGAHTHRI